MHFDRSMGNSERPFEGTKVRVVEESRPILEGSDEGGEVVLHVTAHHRPECFLFGDLDLHLSACDLVYSPLQLSSLLGKAFLRDSSSEAFTQMMTDILPCMELGG